MMPFVTSRPLTIVPRIHLRASSLTPISRIRPATMPHLISPIHTIPGIKTLTQTAPSIVYLASSRSPSNSSSARRIGGSNPPAPPSGGRGSDGEQIKIGDLMQTSGVKFGTSGARGLATDMTDRVCFAYALGFLKYLFAKGELHQGDAVAFAGDLRPSTARIMTAVATAINHFGLNAINMGLIPSPAAALYGIKNQIPTVMVTGSHIPADRNGIKFNKADGEILKTDEAGIKEQIVTIPRMFNADGSFLRTAATILPTVINEAKENFIHRYTNLFGPVALKGLKIGVYQHSSVGRDMLVEVLRGLGAKVTELGRSDKFIPVDTEAIREEDVRLAKEWAVNYRFDAIVSLDGDGDRPLIAGQDGKWLRGDVLGILVAKFLRADSVSTPVSSNTALEKSKWFKDIRRTRIGSPYVIASMMEAVNSGFKMVVSYEANGGFLTATDIKINGRTSTALPTRDAFLPIIAALMLSIKEKKPVEELVASLPERFTWSDRIKNVPQEQSQRILNMFNTGHISTDRIKIEEHFRSLFGEVTNVNSTDGVRITFTSDNIVHLRPSGNTPEFRFYTESDSEDKATEINRQAMEIVNGILSQR